MRRLLIVGVLCAMLLSAGVAWPQAKPPGFVVLTQQASVVRDRPVKVWIRADQIVRYELGQGVLVTAYTANQPMTMVTLQVGAGTQTLHVLELPGEISVMLGADVAPQIGEQPCAQAN